MLLIDCACTHIEEDDLKEHLSAADEAMKRIADGAAGVRLALSDTMCVETHLYAFC
jgi:hypothetical protein